MTMTEGTCQCGCGTMTVVTEAAEPCACGCKCCRDQPRPKDDEVVQLRRLRATIDRRLEVLGEG